MKSERCVVGKHVYGNLYGCPVDIIGDEAKLRGIVVKAVELANAKLWELKSWSFGGEKGGVSVIALVVESHIAIHTWVEYEYATVDVFTCGENSDPEKAFDYIVAELKPKRFTKHYVDRSNI